MGWMDGWMVGGVQRGTGEEGRAECVGVKGEHRKALEKREKIKTPQMCRLR